MSRFAVQLAALALQTIHDRRLPHLTTVQLLHEVGVPDSGGLAD
jgi:hypothetical protein